VSSLSVSFCAPLMPPYSRRKRLVLAALLSCLLALVAIWRIRVASTERDVAFVGSVSQLPLPKHPRDAVSFDDGQSTVLVTFVLSPAERATILRAANFHRAAHGGTRVTPQSPSDFRSINRLPASARVIHGAGDLYHGGGCSPHHSWTALLDTISNRVWIEVMYPDWSGDDPGCLFPNVDRFSSWLDVVHSP
jgi:hypothetical protein